MSNPSHNPLSYPSPSCSTRRLPQLPGLTISKDAFTYVNSEFPIVFLPYFKLRPENQINRLLNRYTVLMSETTYCYRQNNAFLFSAGL